MGLESVYYLYSSLSLSLSLWHCSGHVISYSMLNGVSGVCNSFLIFLWRILCTIKDYKCTLNVKTLFFSLFSSCSQFYDYISVQAIFVGGCFFLQLAWIRRSVRNELEAESRSGQLLFFTEPQSPSTQLWFSTQSLKKTKGMPSFGQRQSCQVDFIALYVYNNYDNDCNVHGESC